MAFNLGMLGLFKYFDFFSASLADLCSLVGFSADPVLLNWILPIGISFYTFQTMSYSIDVYKERIEPTKNIIQFLTYVSFFPQLVAGPIERAQNMLPQFNRKREFSYADATDGMRQTLWGLVKKILIADNCALYVDYVYLNYMDLNGLVILMGVFLFVIQVYCDFSGYTDIAIGCSRLFGIQLMQNFNFPYFSKNMSEFYKRWHISLSTWIRDYVYTPLSLRLRSLNKSYRYIVVFLITFTLFGFWHGANWAYISFGALQGIALSWEHYSRKKRKKLANGSFGKVYLNLSVFLTFAFWSFSMMLFRSPNLETFFGLLQGIFGSFSIQNFTIESIADTLDLKYIFIIVFVFMIVEYFQKHKIHGLDIRKLPMVVRWSTYIVLLILVTNFGPSQEVPFVYFQF